MKILPLDNAAKTKVSEMVRELGALIFKDPRAENPCCRKGASPHSLRKIFHTLTRIHFSSPDNYGDLKDELACLVYDPDPNVSTLDILLTDLPRSEGSPEAAVIVSVKETTFKQLSMGDFAGDHPDGAGQDMVREASTKIFWRCRHPDPDVSQLMAQSLLDFLTMTKTSMAEKIGLTSMQLLGVSEPKFYNKPPNSVYESYVMSDVSYLYSLSVREESHVLKRFNIITNV